jgi:RNase P/RNase MRP subunit p30
MYVNSCLPFSEDRDRFRSQLQLLYRIGYQIAVVDLKNENEWRAYKQLWGKHSEPIPSEIAITTLNYYKPADSPLILIPRTTLKCQNPNLLKQDLAIWTDRSVLIAVQSTDKATLEVAARDGRVDLLALPELDHWLAITKGIISLSKQNKCLLDISLTSILTSNRYQRSRILRELYRLFLQTKPISHAFTVGSYSSEMFQFRGPNESMALLTTLFNIGEPFTKNILRENGEMLALRYMKRDLQRFIEPNVEIVKIISDSENNQLRKEIETLERLSVSNYDPLRKEKHKALKEEKSN